MLSQFISNARHNIRFPVSAISRIRSSAPRESGIVYYDLELTDGTTFAAPEYEVDRILDPIIQAIPAGDGYSIIHGDEAPVWRSTIIAWAVRATGDISPLTIQGEWDGFSLPMPVEMPDGRVYFPAGDTTFDDVDRYLGRHRPERADAAS